MAWISFFIGIFVGFILCITFVFLLRRFKSWEETWMLRCECAKVFPSEHSIAKCQKMASR